MQTLSSELRSGAMLGLIVSVIVGIVGLAQLDQRLMLIGLFAGPTILLLNAILIALGKWHKTNTDPTATYVSAEDMVRLKRQRANRRASAKI